MFILLSPLGLLLLVKICWSAVWEMLAQNQPVAVQWVFLLFGQLYLWAIAV